MVEDSLISQGKDVTLVVINPSPKIVLLEGGRRIGAIQPASWIGDQKALQTENPGKGKCASGLVQSILPSSPEERQEQIQQLVQSLGVGNLDPPVRAQLETLLQEFHDIFALSDRAWLYRHYHPHYRHWRNEPYHAIPQGHPLCIALQGRRDGCWNAGSGYCPTIT